MRWLGVILCAGLLGLGMAGVILDLAPSAVPLAAPAPGGLPEVPISPTAAIPPHAEPVRATLHHVRFAHVLRRLWQAVCRRYPGPDDADLVIVDVRTERLYLLHQGRVADVWPVSTSIHGLDQIARSYGTPSGVFRIARKLGAGMPLGEVLRDQVPTGRVVAPVRTPDDPAASHWITTRILWLSGEQPGWNEGGDFDTFRRHIYIHGTANVGMLGRPASLGCVQMAPKAVVALYRAVPVGTPVLITPGTRPLAAIPGPALG